MKSLSPSAQAVLDAANGKSSYGPDDCLNESCWIAAAALRAAADQAQASLYHTTPSTDWSKGWKQGASDAAQGFLAIAAELEQYSESQ